MLIFNFKLKKKKQNFKIQIFLRISDLVNNDSILHAYSPYRITPYIIGILLAYMLIKYKKEKLTDIQLNAGWLVAVLCFVATSTICSECAENLSKINMALFNSICTITFCVFIAWIIFTTELGYKSKKCLKVL